MATSSWDPGPVFSQCPHLHELDLIRANQKTVRVLEGSASKWDRIALRLYFSRNKISQIRTESQNDTFRACQSVFSEWLDGKEGLRIPRTWTTVFEVLKEAHLSQIADDVAEVLRARNTLDTPNQPQWTFPLLKNTGMSSKQYEKLQTRLYSESIELTGKFGVMFNAVFQSLREREISIKEIVGNLKAFGAFTRVYKGEYQPLLREELNSLNLTEADIDDIKLIILDYCSFFNFRLLKFLIDVLGTTADKRKFEQYEREFNEYAQRRIFECPSELGKPSDTSQANIIVKLDDHYDQCTLNQLKLLEADFCKIFNVTNLKLCLIAAGCLQLTFQVPWFVKREIFPLSQEQKEALTALHAVRMTCGYYCYLDQPMPTVTQGHEDKIITRVSPQRGSSPSVIQGLPEEIIRRVIPEREPTPLDTGTEDKKTKSAVRSIMQGSISLMRRLTSIGRRERDIETFGTTDSTAQKNMRMPSSLYVSHKKSFDTKLRAESTELGAGSALKISSSIYEKCNITTTPNLFEWTRMDTELDMTDYYRVLRYTRRLSEDEFDQLSRALGISSPILTSDNMVREWLMQGLYSTSQRPTWRRLTQAMREVGLAYMAREIEMDVETGRKYETGHKYETLF